MTVSCAVVIPTRNAAPTLDQALRAMTAQTREPDRIIVVDGNSTDGTQDIAAKYHVELISEGPGRRTAGLARNIGAAVSEEDFLLFMDADQTADSTVVEECARLVEAGYDAIVLPESTAGHGFLGKWRSWERVRIQREPTLVFARAIRRVTFEQVGRFDPEMVGFEDLDLQARLIEAGCRMASASAHVIHHEELLDFATYLRKRKRYMSSWSRFREKHPALFARLSSPTSRLKLYLVDIQGPSDVFWFIISSAMGVLELSLRDSAAPWCQ